MKKELLIAAGVLVPFAVLVALGFRYAAPEPGPVAPGAIPVAPPALPKPSTPAAPAPVAAPRAVGELDAGRSPEPPAWPRALAAPLAAVAPEVHRCFADARERLRAPVTTKVRFTPTRDGGFAGVAIETTAPDPWMKACVEDVFEEVRYAPSGAETFEPAEHTFSFDPSGD